MKVGVLVRESKLDGGQSGTVDTQRDFLLHWCQQQGHVVVDVYVDDGVSGLIPLRDRPEGARLFRDAQRRRFEAVVLSRVDRAGRNLAVILAFHDELQSLGIPCLFAMQPMDTQTPSGRMQFHLYGVFADWERAMLIERMHEGRKHTARNGGWAGGPPPLGYRVMKGGEFPVLAVDREPAQGLSFSEAKLVARIFRDFVDCYPSVQAVADALDAERVPPPRQINCPRHGRGRGRDDGWSDATVYRILTNPLYKGLLQWGQRGTGKPTYECEAPHLAIVPADLWERAQRRLRENSKRSTRNAKQVYLLGRGLLRCAACGYAYAGRNYGEGRGGRVYICTGRSQHRALRCDKCAAPILKADQYECAAWNCIVQFVRHPHDALDRLAKQLKDQPDDAQEQADQLVSALAALKESRRRAERLFVRGTWDEERLEEEIAALNREQAAFQERLEELQGQLTDFARARQRLAAAERLLSELRDRIDVGFTAEEQRRIIQDAASQVLVELGPDGWRVRVQFVFGEPLLEPSEQVLRRGLQRAHIGTVPANTPG